MESRVRTLPTPSDIVDWLQESKQRNACISLYARCEVFYDGRARADLASGDRFILCKPDGSFVVHTDSGCDPKNWMPPGAQISITETDPVTLTATRSDPDEVIRVTCEEVYHMSFMPIDDDAELELHGSEADLQDYIYDNPEVIEDGFRATEKERETAAGPVDIWGYDENGDPVLLELKRRTAGPDDVDQLRRYLDHIEMDVRGMLIAPGFSDRSLEMLDTHGLEYREIEPPSAGREVHHTLSDF